MATELLSFVLLLKGSGESYWVTFCGSCACIGGQHGGAALQPPPPL